MAAENKRSLYWLEDSLKAYKEDEEKSSEILINVKEACKKTVVAAINVVRVVSDLISTVIHTAMGALQFIKIFICDIPAYVLSSDDASSEKTWDNLKEEVKVGKHHSYEWYQNVRYLAVDSATIVKHAGLVTYHTGATMYTGLTYMYSAAKRTAKLASNVLESLEIRVMPRPTLV